jgi:hypothetical protein
MGFLPGSPLTKRFDVLKRSVIPFITWSIDVLKSIINPTNVVPNKTMNAPAPVIRDAIPVQACFPIIPARDKVSIETKNSKLPTKTLGWFIGLFILVKRRPADIKINGKRNNNKTGKNKKGYLTY